MNRAEFDPLGVPGGELVPLEPRAMIRQLKQSKSRVSSYAMVLTPGADRAVGPGAFRPQLVSDAKSEQIGVGIIAYYGLADLQEAIKSIKQHGGDQYRVCVFDNSENAEVLAWLLEEEPWVDVIHSPYNVGCWNARDRLAEHFGARGIQHFVVHDQDVEWRMDIVPRMKAVFDAHPKTGVVTLPLALRQMGAHRGPDGRIRCDETGALRTPEAPGMCCMFSMQAVVDTAKATGDAWPHDWLMYRGDTMFCLKAHYKAGYGIRVVQGEDMESAVSHNHPHGGILRNNRWRQEQARSQRMFRAECKRLEIPIPPGLG